VPFEEEFGDARDRNADLTATPAIGGTAVLAFARARWVFISAARVRLRKRARLHSIANIPRNNAAMDCLLVNGKVWITFRVARW
jgi:hypothetical protein